MINRKLESYKKQQQQLSQNVSSNKSLHNEYFQNLQNRLISHSNKLSNYLGTSHLKMVKANSQQFSYNQSQYDQIQTNKNYECTSFSPSKKRVKQIHKIYQQKQKQRQKQKNFNLAKNYQNPPQSYHTTQADEFYKKLLQIKQNFIQKQQQFNFYHGLNYQNQMSNSTNSNNQNRNIAYNYDFITIENQPKRLINPKITQATNSKQILKTVYDKKQKMTQTISTTSSYSNKKFISHFTAKLPTPKVIGLKDFQIIKSLGQGKFGMVYLVRHIQSNLICALKKIPKQIEDQCIIDQLIRQIKIQLFLDHPNITQLYTFFVENDNIHLIMELCYSGNLYSHLKCQGSFSEQKVQNIIKQVSYALQYLHQHDIIHRDIKPQNIILHQNIVKLCDFGWSVYAPLSRGTLCGTPIYASPELVMKTQYNSKIDVWNIGILTYQLLFGRVPFEIRCQEDLKKVIQDQIYFPKSIQISQIAKDFIRQCLNKNPQYRVSIAKLLDHQFIYQKDRYKNYNRSYI